MDSLAAQKSDEAEILVCSDNGERSIGEKRNQLIREAAGDYVCFIDDDDEVSGDYIASLLAGLANRPDCVGFKAIRFIDGRIIGNPQVMSINNHRNRDILVDAERGIFRMERRINHLCPVRRELTEKVGFPNGNRSEALAYAVALQSLLKSEVFVDKVLYYYKLRTNRPGEITNEGLSLDTSTDEL